MKTLACIILLYSLGTWLIPVSGQSFRQEIENHRTQYKEKFAYSTSAPIKESDLKYLRFFFPDSTYRVRATFEPTPSSQPFDMPTYSGMKKEFVKYGELHFILNGKEHTLSVYSNLALRAIPQYKNHLFLPFKDLTNARESYGGGRYIDLETTDIKDSVVLLDFNKAYNPYCAYSDGFNCPIPPQENHLPVRIEAGEQNFGKDQ
jgi:uncharacterized protein